jgi:polysaccharide pyruvyl transferase WcaK-like protein
VCGRQRIALTHMSSDRNKGDHAILSATVHALRELAPDAELTVISAELPRAALDDPVETRLTRALGCEILGTPVPSRARFPGRAWRWIISMLRAEAFLWARPIIGDRALLLIPPNDREYFRTLRDSDVVVAKGGSYLHALGGVRETVYLWRMLYPLRVSHSYRRRTVLLGVSFGTSYSLLTRAMIRRALRSCAMVCAREPISFALARSELRIRGGELHLIPDLAFLISNPRVEHRAADGLLIGVTVRYNRFPTASPAVALDRYVHALIGVLRSLLTRYGQARVIFIPQVLEDIPLAKEIAAGLGSQDRVEVIDADLSLEALLAVYGHLDLLVGARLHSVILSAVTGVPFVHVIVERSKSQGTLEMLGMESAGVPYDGIDEHELMRVVENAIVNQHRVADHLRVRVNEHRRMLEEPLRKILTGAAR